MIYLNNSQIKDWNFGDDNIAKVYYDNAVCYYKVISSGGTTQLPDVPFTVNYNAKNYDSTTKALAKTSGQLADVDAVITTVITSGTPTVHDTYLTIAAGTRATISGYQQYFNRDYNNPNLTIISKQRTDYYNCHLFANRGNNFNWMYRPYNNRLTLHGSDEQGSVAVTTQPVIESVRVDSNRTVTYNNYTDNTSSNYNDFGYGSANSQGTALFSGYYSSSGEWFSGDFYWIYMSQSTLTDEQVQQVIDYNEGNGGGETPPTPPHDYSQDYLTFVAKQDSTFTFSGNSINYSLDSGSTWATLAANTATPTIATGNKILWKATLTPSSSGIGRFSSTGQFDVEGNEMSLLYGDNFVGETDLTGKNNAFRALFSGCTGMTSAENLSLPATTLAANCYHNMFNGCTSLTTAPSILPATTLKDECYQNMFIHDASLTTVPELHAATLATRCYQGIFFGCSNLNYIKCLATDISATNCTSDWVTYVSSSGTFVKAANMTSWGTGRNGIPSGWTVIDDV